MAEHIIEIKVEEKIASVVGDPMYVCGNSDYVVKFDFDAEWAEFETKTARFVKNNREYIDVVFTGDRCQMPIIENTASVKIGVYAGHLSTTTAATINAQISILCGSGMPADPEPDVYAQIMAKINSIMLKGDTAENVAPPVIAQATGMAIVATDSADRLLRGLTVYGKTTQDGTPSEDAPVEMQSVGGAGDIVVSVLAGLPEGGTDRIAIIRQPRGVTVAAGEVATFGVLAVGRGLTYQWEYWNKATWNNSASTGNDTDTVTFTAKAYHDGYKYRCLITDASGNTVRTDEVTLTIGEASGSDDGAADTQTATISIADALRGVPVSGNDATYTDADGQGWIADTVEYDAETGTAQLIRRVANVTYFGGADENWVKGGSGSYFAIKRADKSSASHGLCTHYPGLAINAGEYKVGFTAATDKEYIRFRPTGYADMTGDQWRARLEASPVTVLYALAEPVTMPITGDELTALAQLRSRYPATTIYNDAGAQMVVRYVADTKNYVDQQIEQLTNAVVSLGGNV